jgi:hypothetical protein
MNSLTGLHGHLTPFRLHDQGPAQHDRKFLELRPLPGLSPARRAPHVRDAQTVLARVSPSDVLIDQLGRLARRSNPAWLADQFRHNRQYPAGRVTRRSRRSLLRWVRANPKEDAMDSQDRVSAYQPACWHLR